MKFQDFCCLRSFRLKLILLRSFFISFSTLFNTISLILKKWSVVQFHFNSPNVPILFPLKTMFTRGIKSEHSENSELKTKYSNKFIWTYLGLLTFKIIILLWNFYILCSPFGKVFCKLFLYVPEAFYDKGQDIWKSSLFSKKATLTIIWNKEI